MQFQEEETVCVEMYISYSTCMLFMSCSCLHGLGICNITEKKDNTGYMKALNLKLWI